MPAERTVLFAASIFLLLFAHVIRATRHSYLFSRNDIHGRFDLLLALVVGYGLNAFLPFRLGEIVRIALISLRLRLPVSYTAATVVAERTSDLFVAGCLLVCLAFMGSALEQNDLYSGQLLIVVAIIIGIASAAIIKWTMARRLTWRISSLFNDQLRIKMVTFIWSAAQLLWTGQILTRRFLTATAAMWFAYLAAYWAFGQAMKLQLSAVAHELLSSPMRAQDRQLMSGNLSQLTLAFFIFTTFPIVIVMLYGAMRNHRHIARSVMFAWRFGLDPVESMQQCSLDRFECPSDFATFLNAHFSHSNHAVSDFTVNGLGDAVVHRILPGGSDAVTALVESNDILVIRKFAMGDGAEKLKRQAEWLRRNNGKIPLPQVINERQEGNTYRYDMPYILAARDFYEVIHTMPIERSQTVINEVVAAMVTMHSEEAGTASEAIIDEYLERKAINNAREVLSFSRLFLDGNEFTINDQPYSLSEWDCLIDKKWLRSQISRRQTGLIHGDLTVENIIICQDHYQGWYAIDPNPENIFQSPLIDWAKLMQSFNLGYEEFNRGNTAIMDGNNIKLFLTKSNAYANLHDYLEACLIGQFGEAVMQEISFHELINYLRLTPYKIRQGRQKALTFFACASLLLRRYNQAANA